MTAQDIRIAALEEAAQVAERVAAGCGPMTAYVAHLVAKRIRVEIAREVVSA